MPKRKCLNCGKDTRSDKRLYCSPKCAKEYRRRPDYEENRRCVICGNRLPRGRTAYCSNECAYQASLKTRGIKRRCRFCGKNISKLKAQVMYCSDECRKEAYNLKRAEYRKKTNASMIRSLECICPKCGNRHKKVLFWTGNGTPRIYCYNCERIGSNQTYPDISPLEEHRIDMSGMKKGRS